MAYDQIHIVDATSQMIEVALRSSSTGQLLTGKAYGDMTIKYQREGAAAATTVSVVTATKGSYTSGGFVETDIAGLYQFGIPTGALATGAKAVTLTFACTGALDVVKRIVLISADLRNVTSLGLSNLDAAVSTRSTYAGGDTSGVTTLLGRIVGTLAAGTHNPQAGDAYARIGAAGAGLTTLGDARIANLDATVSSRNATTPPTVGAIAGAVWDEALSGHATSGTAGKKLTDLANADLSGVATASALATLAGYVDTEVAAILAAVDTEVAAIKAKTDNLPTDPADESLLEAAITSAVSPLATAASIAALNNISSAQVQTAATAALNAYDPPTNTEMEARTLAAANYATATVLDAVGNFVDTEVAAIKAVTDKLDTALVLDGAVYQLTANALELAPAGGGGGATAQQIWEYADGTGRTINSVSGSVGSIATDGISAAAVSAAAASKIAAAVIAGGTGTYSYSNTVDDGSGNLLDGVFVQCATDTGFTNIVSTATTNSLGAFTVYSDTAGTHYLRLQFSGITFAIQTVTLA